MPGFRPGGAARRRGRRSGVDPSFFPGKKEGGKKGPEGGQLLPPLDAPPMHARPHLADQRFFTCGGSSYPLLRFRVGFGLAVIWLEASMKVYAGRAIQRECSVEPARPLASPTRGPTGQWPVGSKEPFLNPCGTAKP